MANLAAFDTTLTRDFGFEFDGNLLEEVQSISFGKVELAKVEVDNATSDGKNVKKIMPGKRSVSDVSITAYLTDKIQTIIDHFETAQLGDLAGARKGGAIIVYDSMHSEIMRYEMINAWVSSISFADVTAKSADPVTVSITFAVEDVNLKSG